MEKFDFRWYVDQPNVVFAASCPKPAYAFTAIDRSWRFGWVEHESNIGHFVGWIDSWTPAYRIPDDWRIFASGDANRRNPLLALSICVSTNLADSILCSKRSDCTADATCCSTRTLHSFDAWLTGKRHNSGCAKFFPRISGGKSEFFSFYFNFHHF